MGWMESKKDQQKMNTTDAGCSSQWQGAQFSPSMEGHWGVCPAKSLGCVFLCKVPSELGKARVHRAGGAVCEDRLPYPRHMSSKVPIGEVVFCKVAQNKRKRPP